MITISKHKLKEIKEEALKWDKLIEGDAIGALKAGNQLILRYLVNRLERIRRCVSREILLRVEKGNDKAVEEALRSLLLCPWGGPRVKIKDSSEEDRLEKGERMYKQFVISNREWLDVNIQANLIKGIVIVGGLQRIKSIINQ